ncbi:MAG: family 16 glycoside hydrolase, partial [Planctomycetota bacterium]
TLAELFRGAGYATGHVGKWHLGHQIEERPLGQGFDHSFGHMVGCIDNYSHFFYWNGPNRHDLWLDGKEIHRPGEYFPDMMVQQAKSFIDQSNEQPFFLYFASNAPHYPYQGTPRWLKKYRDLPYPRNLYAAFLSSLDERIGQLLAHLNKKGLSENTIVIFQSDHGFSTEERAHYGGGSAGPFRGSKFSLFEGGLRVPAIIRWPKGIPAGQTRDQLAHGCDWFPTLAELCDIPLPERKIDGKSLVPIINDANSAELHKVFHWGNDRGSWSVRRGDWKLIHRPFNHGKSKNQETKRWLSHLAKDPGETTNYIDEQEELAAELTKLHEAFVADVRSTGNSSQDGAKKSEDEGPWRVLFDGTDLSQWREYRKSAVTTGWEIVGDALRCVPREEQRSKGLRGRGEDIITKEKYSSFELELEFKVTPEANSGIMYHVIESGDRAPYTGPEIQIQDNVAGHDKQKCGWLYQMYDCDIDATKPAGQWNTLSIKITPQECVHVLNGVEYVRYVKGSEDWKQRVAKSKFSRFPAFGLASSGHIVLQDHTDEVFYRNIRVRRLD